MQNQKVIVVNGISRGGTNILWNLIMSHPDVCSAMRETSRIFAPFQKHRLRFVGDTVLGSPLMLIPPLPSIAGPLIDRRLYNFKLRNFGEGENGAKYEGVPYTQAEVARSAVCLKSINKTIYATDLFYKIYGERIFFVSVIRNGYGICESWMRREVSAEKAGRRYRQYAQRMIDYSQKYERYLIVRFEDILADPFGEMEKVFTFCQLEPARLPKLRLKAKRVLKAEGDHETPSDEYQVGTKYWMDEPEMRRFLVPNVSDIQKKTLSPEDKAAFERDALPVLKYFHYA